MIWWGVKMADCGDGGGQALFGPPCPPLGAAPNIWAMVLNQTRGESVGGGYRGCHPPGEIRYYRAPPWDVGTPPGDFFDQNQKKSKIVETFKF